MVNSRTTAPGRNSSSLSQALPHPPHNFLLLLLDSFRAFYLSSRHRLLLLCPVASVVGSCRYFQRWNGQSLGTFTWICGWGRVLLEVWLKRVHLRALMSICFAPLYCCSCCCCLCYRPLVLGSCIANHIFATSFGCILPFGPHCHSPGGVSLNLGKFQALSSGKT